MSQPNMAGSEKHRISPGSSSWTIDKRSSRFLFLTVILVCVRSERLGKRMSNRYWRCWPPVSAYSECIRGTIRAIHRVGACRPRSSAPHLENFWLAEGRLSVQHSHIVGERRRRMQDRSSMRPFETLRSSESRNGRGADLQRRTAPHCSSLLQSHPPRLFPVYCLLEPRVRSSHRVNLLYRHLARNMLPSESANGGLSSLTL